MEKVLVTGGAGFIGHHLVNALKEKNVSVTVIDNLSTGKKEFVPSGVKFVNGDLTDKKFVMSQIKGFDTVFHFAANCDVRLGESDTDIDVEQNILATHNVLEAMRMNGVNNIVFPSTSTVYGEAKKIPTPESYAPMMPISMYGAAKLSCEALISAYCHTFGMKAWIFRFANVIGPRATHGVIYDFVEKLKNNPEELEVLGNGKQKKSYIYVDDCVMAILHGVEHANEEVNIYNIGSDDSTCVKDIAKMTIEEMDLNAKIKYTGGERGWKGDVKNMLLSNKRLRGLGWKPKYNSKRSVMMAIRSLVR